MQKRKKSVQIIALVLAILMALGVLSGVISTLVASGASVTEIDQKISQAKSELSSLEGESGSLNSQLAELEEQLSELRAEESGYLEQVAILQQQRDLLVEKITLTEEQVEIYEGMISDKEEQLEDAVKEEEEQLELYKKRIRAMEERGNLNYIQILLSSKNFTELMTKISDINEIIASDNEISQQLETNRIAVEQYKEELETDMSELEALVVELDDQRSELESQVAEIDEMIDKVQTMIDDSQFTADELQAEKDRVDAEMLALAQSLEDLTEERKAEIARLEEEAASTGSAGGNSVQEVSQGSGIFAWPSNNSTRITSPFGSRSSPGGIGSTNHQGVDIGAAYGTEVLASASGTVSFAGWSGGYGNYIMINHGNGYATAYAHLSQINVSVGDTVVQGQVIGLVGSTGNSTGPHLHFEILVNGTRVNPMNYF